LLRGGILLCGDLESENVIDGLVGLSLARVDGVGRTFPQPTLSPINPPPFPCLLSIHRNPIIWDGKRDLVKSGCHGFLSLRWWSNSSTFSKTVPKKKLSSSNSAAPPSPNSSSETAPWGFRSGSSSIGHGFSFDPLGLPELRGGDAVRRGPAVTGGVPVSSV
jgi:hypothetical protein